MEHEVGSEASVMNGVNGERRRCERDSPGTLERGTQCMLQ